MKSEQEWSDQFARALKEASEACSRAGEAIRVALETIAIREAARRADSEAKQ